MESSCGPLGAFACIKSGRRPDTPVVTPVSLPLTLCIALGLRMHPVGNGAPHDVFGAMQKKLSLKPASAGIGTFPTAFFQGDAGLAERSDGMLVSTHLHKKRVALLLPRRRLGASLAPCRRHDLCDTPSAACSTGLGKVGWCRSSASDGTAADAGVVGRRVADCPSK